jgi:hypothetical protein
MTATLRSGHVSGEQNILAGGATVMRMRNYTKQIEKRQKIANRTLVVGIDIGSKFNAVCLMDKEGEVLGRYPKVYNSRKGFDYFHAVVGRTCDEGA